MKKHTTFVILAHSCLWLDGYGQVVAKSYVERHSQQAVSEKTRDDAEGYSLGDAAFSSGKQVITEKPMDSWMVVPSYSHSFFNKGREDWQRETLDIVYQPQKNLLLGAGVDFIQRPPNDDDIMYSFNASWYPTKNLEVHGEISYTPDANFMPNESYSVGFQYFVHPKVALSLDVDRLYIDPKYSNKNFHITQVQPGLEYWFTEKSNITLRYAHGWFHGESDFDYYSIALNYGDMPRDGKLTIGFAYGTDPELDFGTTGATLSDAYIVSIFYKEPIKPDLSVFVGLEYVYRLRPDNGKELYQSLTPTVGFIWKF